MEEMEKLKSEVEQLGKYLINYTNVVDEQAKKLKGVSEYIHDKLEINKETGEYFYIKRFTIDDLKAILDIVEGEQQC